MRSSSLLVPLSRMRDFMSGTVTVMQTPSDYHNLVWDSRGQSAGWGRSAWDSVEVIDAGAA